MRYPAAEKLEIIRLVEQSHLPVRLSLKQIGIPRSTFYRWCDLYQTGGPEALDDRSPRPDRVWNRIPDDVRAGSSHRLLRSSALRGLGRGGLIWDHPARPNIVPAPHAPAGSVSIPKMTTMTLAGGRSAHVRK